MIKENTKYNDYKQFFDKGWRLHHMFSNTDVSVKKSNKNIYALIKRIIDISYVDLTK